MNRTIYKPLLQPINQNKLNNKTFTNDFHIYNPNIKNNNKCNIIYEKTKEDLIKLKMEIKTKSNELFKIKMESIEKENILLEQLRGIEKLVSKCEGIQKEINDYFNKNEKIINNNNNNNNKN